MNRQKDVDKRSIELHKSIIKRLKQHPSLWSIPLSNIERWSERRKSIPVPYQVWKEILTTSSKEEIVKVLLSHSQRSTLLRSSSPFTGIIDYETRNKIFLKYKMDQL